MVKRKKGQLLMLSSSKGLLGTPVSCLETGLGTHPKHPGPQKVTGRSAAKQECLSATLHDHHPLPLLQHLLRITKWKRTTISPGKWQVFTSPPAFTLCFFYYL